MILKIYSNKKKIAHMPSCNHHRQLCCTVIPKNMTSTNVKLLIAHSHKSNKKCVIHIYCTKNIVQVEIIQLSILLFLSVGSHRNRLFDNENSCQSAVREINCHVPI